MFDLMSRIKRTCTLYNGRVVSCIQNLLGPRVVKGELATGDGRFIHRVDASRIIVISSSEPIDNLETLLQAAQVDSTL